MTISYNEKGEAVSFTGQDVRVFQVAALRSGLGLLAVGIKPHRTWTSVRLALATATQYTGRHYKGKKDIERARQDLGFWLDDAIAKADKVQQ
jgi:hypothetical protein